jgi:hypothetical protein
MLDRKKFAEAVRYADARSDEIGPQAYLASKNIDIEGLAFVVRERALRLAMLYDGVSEAEMRRINATNEPTAVRLSPEAEALLPYFGAAIMDGVSMHAAALDIEAREG